LPSVLFILLKKAIMMNAKLILSGLALMAGLTSCKPGNQASATSESADNKETTVSVSNNSDSQSNTSRLIISFISIGEGTDFKAKDTMDVFLARYQDENKKTVKYESVPWGREGEVDFCFKLSELNSKEQKKFVEDIRAKLKFSELVQVSENQPCRQRR
jgi:hypothetical protein